MFFNLLRGRRDSSKNMQSSCADCATRKGKWQAASRGLLRGDDEQVEKKAKMQAEAVAEAQSKTKAKEEADAAQQDVNKNHQLA